MSKEEAEVDFERLLHEERALKMRREEEVSQRLREEELARQEEELLQKALSESLAEFTRKAAEERGVEEAVMASTKPGRRKRKMVYVPKLN